MGTFRDRFGETEAEWQARAVGCGHQNRVRVDYPASMAGKNHVLGALGEIECQDCGTSLGLWGGEHDGGTVEVRPA